MQITENNFIFVFVNQFKMKKIIAISIFIIASFQLFSQSTEVPFTLEDRDRIIKLEEKVNSNNEKIESLRNEMNAKFEGIDNRFDAMESRFDAMESRFEGIYWMLGIIVTIVLFTLGYMIWDRRTALYPVQQKSFEHEERLRKLEHVAKEQAKKDPSFAELLRVAGLL